MTHMNVRFVLVGFRRFQADTRGHDGVHMGCVKSAGVRPAAAGVLEKERLLHQISMSSSVCEMSFIC